MAIEELVELAETADSDNELRQRQRNVITRYNQRYAITSVGSKVGVVELDRDGHMVGEPWPPHEFFLRDAHERVEVLKKEGSKKTIWISAARFWFHHSEARRFRRMILVPPGSSERLHERDYNLWRGFAVKPKPGSWEKNKQHLQEVICGGREPEFKWLMNWLAALVQQPGRHAFTAIVLHGDQGTGKGHFAEHMVGKLFHPAQYQVVGAAQLTAEFNSHLSGKVIVFADEASWGGDKRAMAKLKALVTGDTVAIRRLYYPLVNEPSSLHLIIASNEDWPIAVDASDRRYSVFRVSSKYANDIYYFEGLHRELENGGREAMLHELLQWKVDLPMTKRPLDNEERREMKARSLSREEKWLQDFLMNPPVGYDGRFSRRELHQNYEAYCYRNSRFPPLSMAMFGKFLSRIFVDAGLERGLYPRETKSAGINYYIFPSLPDFRAMFDQACGTSTDWPAREEGERALKLEALAAVEPLVRH